MTTSYLPDPTPTPEADDPTDAAVMLAATVAAAAGATVLGGFVGKELVRRKGEKELQR